MKTTERKKVNRAIGEVVKPIYFEAIPLQDLFDTIESFGYLVVDEEHNPWTGFLCGAEGTVCFDILDKDTGKLDKSNLLLQWYTMPSGRYEITAYVA